MTDSDQGVRIPEPPGDDPKNYSEGAKSYVKKVAEDGEDKGKKKSLEDPGTEVEASGKWRVANLLTIFSSS